MAIEEMFGTVDLLILQNGRQIAFVQNLTPIGV